MDIIIPVLVTLFSVFLFLGTLELVRRNRLKEKYAILWLFSSSTMFYFSISRDSLHALSNMIGIKYPPSLIFLLAFLFLIIINIHFSTVISKLSDQNKNLAQEVAFLRELISRRPEEEEKE
jgi:hypothetical protein